MMKKSERGRKKSTLFTKAKEKAEMHQHVHVTDFQNNFLQTYVSDKKKTVASIAPQPNKSLSLRSCCN